MLVLIPSRVRQETKLLNFIKDIFLKYPEAAVLLAWALWVLGAIWEHHGSKKHTLFGGTVLFLFALLAFWLMLVERLGFIRWILAVIILAVGIVIAIFFRKKAINSSGDE